MDSPPPDPTHSDTCEAYPSRPSQWSPDAAPDHDGWRCSGELTRWCPMACAAPDLAFHQTLHRRPAPAVHCFSQPAAVRGPACFPEITPQRVRHHQAEALPRPAGHQHFAAPVEQTPGVTFTDSKTQILLLQALSQTRG